MIGVLFVFCAMALIVLAGQARKWDDVPQAVRATILAHGGKAGSVDKESHKINGQSVYEALGKNKNGKDVDLVITEDGKLVEMKDDEPAERETQILARDHQALLALKFSHPQEITNPYLPLASLKQDILEGKEGANTIRIERTARPDLHKKFKLGKQTVQALAVEDREIENGQVAEVAIDYFAQADDGTVLYLGEEVDEYKNGKIVGHSGSWMLGRDTKIPGVLFPGTATLGDKFRSEDVSKEIREDDEVMALAETVTTPAGIFRDCIKVKERLADGAIEFKYYAKGVGVVREVPADGDVLLKSHTTR
jgi:hypothetical protein